MIKAIIFDLGGVILLHEVNIMGHILSKMFGISVEHGVQLWEQRKVGLLKGTVTSEQFIRSIKKDISTNYTLSELLKMWDDLYSKNSEIDQQMLELVQRLKTRYEVYLLTDTIDTHDAYNSTRDIYNKFTRTFKSHIERLTKAEGIRVFEHILRQIKRKPDECIFIDDIDTYVESSKEVGIVGLLFTNIERLKKDLLKLGIQEKE